ncbi:GNAT family N-acetyltransferase [Fulvimarina sp. 2208YS6-2-32]|uniref:GNAT family N-acetyltransferase n=1 Tax=Fulvimarina uroteuthidis TaxID=3098149 RepID=A0ABU5I5R2_9HYPH|nr:GNAT family N-acetyltransferase [Fulvimarina sp. 2208YS6-2-32]MDY8110546.1 GNAT family N-acetyltransferase [Fulvimarina sp. 2208YS6-2-32]
MATTEAETTMQLAKVRRLEALGFRAFPATLTEFDGTWAIRLTPAYPAKRLNSVNPLDPADNQRLGERIGMAAKRFLEVGRPLTFRMSPLASKALVDHFDREHWTCFDETCVLTADLSDIDLGGTIDRLPFKDVERYVAASLTVHGRSGRLANGLKRVIEDIAPVKTMFVSQSPEGEPLGVAMAIHERDISGLLDVAVAAERRGEGLGRDLVRSALGHVRHRGAKSAWVQVEANNVPGLSLYRSLGFREAYRYVYRTPPGAKP